MVIAVKSLGNDEWSRPTLQNIKTGHTYADINLGKGVADWHILTTEGEPLTRVSKEVVFEVIKPIGKCFRCNGDAFPSDVEGYTGVCYKCDENLLPFEIVNAAEVVEDEPDEDHITFFTGDGERIDCCTVDNTASDRHAWDLFKEFGHERGNKTWFQREPHTGEC